jgi:hypothetical protein
MRGPDTDAQDQPPPPFTHIRLATHGRSIQMGHSRRYGDVRCWRKAVVRAQSAFRDRQAMSRNRARELTDELFIQKESVHRLIRKGRKAYQFWP